MPRAGGVYTLPAGNPVVTLTTITSTWANTTLSDIATALTGSLPVDGSAPMTAALKLAAGTQIAPGLTWSLESTSGWYRAGAGDFRWAMGVADILKILSTGLTLPTGSLVVGVPTGLDKGVGTVNAAANFYFNGGVLTTGKVKTANTTRASNIVPTNDPDLAIALQPGTYIVRAALGLTAIAAAGFSLNLNYSGTITNSNIIGTIYSAAATLLTNFTTNVISTTVVGSLFLNSSAAITNAPTLLEAILVCSTAGTLALAWSQNTSNGTGSTVGVGSTLSVVKIA